MNKSWYEFDESTLNKRQIKYLKLLEKTFCVKNEEGKFIPYQLLPYQKEFHSNSLVALGLKNVKDRLMKKCRGIGYTTMSAIDTIMSALYYENTTFPVLSFRFDAVKEIIHNMKKIISYSTLSDMIASDPLETEIRFPSSGSVIKAFPGGNEESVRSIRTISILVDEFAFFRNDEKAFAALQDTISGNGQITIGSTPAGRTNLFWKMTENPSDYGFNYFFYPIFDPTKFNPNKSILEQDIVPLAPFINLEKLEVKKKRDLDIFLQEQMGVALDDATSYIKMNEILGGIDETLVNEIDLLEPISSQYPVYGGMDVATTHDYSVIAIVEKTPFGFVLRGFKYFEKIELPSLTLYVENLLSRHKIDRFKIDATGLGVHISQHLKKKFGSKIVGVHFAERDEDKMLKKEKIAMTLKTLFSDMKIKIFNDMILINHLNEVDRQLQAKRGEHGHADSFWALGLAVTELDDIPEKSKSSIGGNIIGTARRW